MVIDFIYISWVSALELLQAESQDLILSIFVVS